MAVADVTPLTLKTAIIYNTSVAASGQVADYYCAERGIPAANKLGLALGTGYSFTHTTQTIIDINAHLVAIGARACLTAAGCPTHYVVKEVVGSSLGATNVPLHLPAIFALAKRIIRVGGTFGGSLGSSGDNWPATTSYEGGVNSVIAGNGATSNASLWPDAFSTALDSRYQAAISGAYDQAKEWLLFNPTFNFDWSTQDRLPAGIIGLCTYPNSTHDGSLYTKSVQIIRRALQSEHSLAEAKTLPIVFGLSSYTTTLGSPLNNGTAQALAIRELVDNGFTNVTYWRETSMAGDTAAAILAPSPVAWNGNDLSAGTVTPIPFWLLFGFAMINEGEVAPGDIDLWLTQLLPQAGAFTFAGRSDVAHWAQRMQQTNPTSGYDGVGGVMSPTDAAHNSALTITRSFGVVRALIAGKTLAEVCMMFPAHRNIPTGDPLMRPIVV